MERCGAITEQKRSTGESCCIDGIYFRELYVFSQGSGTVKTASHCHQCLTLKLLLIVAVSLFIRSLGGASVQVAGCVCVYSVVLAQCWWSGGRVRTVSAMFWHRIQSQVSCDCVVLTDLDIIWCLQIAVMGKLALLHLTQCREFYLRGTVYTYLGPMKNK